MQQLSGDGGDDLVKRGIENFVGVDLGSSFDERCEQFQNRWKSSLAVGFGVRCFVPQADGRDCVFAGGKKGEFVLESGLLAEHGYDFLLHQEAEFGNAVGFQNCGYFADKHGVHPGFSAKGVIQGTACGLRDLKGPLIHF